MAFAGSLFILAKAALLLDNERQWMVAAMALMLSQLLIIFNWCDARFGTVANVIFAVHRCGGPGLPGALHRSCRPCC